MHALKVTTYKRKIVSPFKQRNIVLFLINLSKMAAKKYTSCNHVYLLPDKSKATFRSLFKDLFFSRKSGKSLLISQNISEEEENKIIHKVMIFVSHLILIFLKLISEPLKKFGHVVEDLLNPGVTQRDSEQYFSIFGVLDTRLDLNEDIKHEDANYYAALTMMASKLAYENEAVIRMAVTQHWKMELVEFYEFNNDFEHKVRTHAYIFREQTSDGDVITVAFKGTSLFSADDWSTDFDFSWVKFQGMGKAHLGFMIAMGLNKFSQNNDPIEDYLGSWPKEIEQNPKNPLAYYTIRTQLKKMIASNPNSKIIITGHSLGAALAIVFTSILTLHKEKELLNSLDAIYTYGQPRVGDEEFGQFVTKRLKKYNIKYDRIVYGYDIVTKVPFDDILMKFKHIGRCIHFNTLYQGKVIEEDKQGDENIILWILKGIIVTLINFVVSRIIAVWEVIRGFLMGYIKGPYYKEGWLMICLRIFLGILFPGGINHFHQDYVNSTCLASEDLFPKPSNPSIPLAIEFNL